MNNWSLVVYFAGEVRFTHVNISYELAHQLLETYAAQGYINVVLANYDLTRELNYGN